MTTATTEAAIPLIHPGDFLRKAREYAGLSQGELATKLDLDPKTVRDAERNARRIRAERVVAWATATGVNAGWLQWNIDACGQADMRFDFAVPAQVTET